MLNVNGMSTAAKTAGAYSVTSSQSMSAILRKKYVAIKINAGAVAKAGMLCANGARNKQAPNNTATVTAVSPVLPPSLIPAPLSIYDVVFDVPTKAPAEVATESARRAFSIPLTSPFSSTFPVRLATLVSVPAVSKNQQTEKQRPYQ